MLRSIMLVLGWVWLSSFAVSAQTALDLPDYVIEHFGTPPAYTDAALEPSVQTALGDVVAIAVNQSSWNPDDKAALEVLARSYDPRLVWPLIDMLRFAWRPEFHTALTEVATTLTGSAYENGRYRRQILNQMIAWDIPTYPGYLDHKRQIFTNYIPGWDALFVDGDIAWELVDWGGVNIDARPFDATDEICHCIPAADNPDTSTAEDATWLKADDIIFGIVINGEARAYPRRIMEVREMVNDTLGGRDLAIPYCTLCGSAQAYFTDRLPPNIKRPVLRTSGLLIRSNKVMYDIETNSIFDTFLGKAVTGPLAEVGLQLDQATVVTSDWGSWRAAYPNTTVLVEELALGRDYNLRETRDANGPIFPIGDVDPRLPVHEDVVGVLTSDGTPVAFPRATAMAALQAGQDVVFDDVRLELAAGGLRAVRKDGSDLPSHEAFWFAWSQFHPDTKLWGGEVDSRQYSTSDYRIQYSSVNRHNLHVVLSR